jgi:hypothetical protein
LFFGCSVWTFLPSDRHDCLVAVAWAKRSKSLAEFFHTTERNAATCFRSQMLAQAEGVEERTIDLARYGQPLVPLIASNGHPRFVAKIATVVSYVIPILLER